MKLKFKTRKTISQVLSIILVCALGLGAIFGVSALSKKLKEDTKVIHPTFEVGGINAAGKGDKDMNGSVYTKDSFECKGLEVKLDFDAKITYQVYYYDDLDNYISNSSVYEASAAMSVPAEAVYARIVVTPIWDEDVKTDDRVCHWYDVAKYSSQLELSVLREQGNPAFLEKIENTATKKDSLYLGQGTYDISNRTFNANPEADWHWFGVYNGTDYDECIIKVKKSAITDMSEYVPEYCLTLLYDLTAQEQTTTIEELNIETLGENGDFVYVSIDISEVGEFVITTDTASCEDFEIWLR